MLGEQKQEVHTLTGEWARATPLLTCERVEVQIHLRDQRGNTEPVNAVQAGVAIEHQALWTFVETLEESPVEVERHHAFGVGRMTVAPPVDKLTPGQLALAERAVVDEAELPIRGDLDVIVDGIAQDDLGFRAIWGEDEVLQWPFDAPARRPVELGQQHGQSWI